jgi:hypothetical protein
MDDGHARRGMTGPAAIADESVCHHDAPTGNAKGPATFREGSIFSRSPTGKVAACRMVKLIGQILGSNRAGLNPSGFRVGGFAKIRLNNSKAPREHSHEWIKATNSVRLSRFFDGLTGYAK